MSVDKLVDSTQLDADLTSVANAIRTKGGTSASLAFPSGFVTAIGNISGGSGWTTDGIAENLEPNGSITLSSSVTASKFCAFRGKPITYITGSAVTIIEMDAFYDCTSLTDIYFPVCTQANTEVFRGSSVVNLTEAQLPALTTTVQASFGTMPELKTVRLSNITAISAYLFDACTKLETAVLPKATSFGGTGAFRGCTSLQKVDMKGSSRIETSTFDGSSSFNFLVLRNTSVVPLRNINAFSNTPFASGKAGGTLYVPSSLVSSYTSTSNWSTILGYMSWNRANTESV